jgi:cytochrome c biogenesis protein CcdA
MSLFGAVLGAPVAFAFGAGLVATINPCGFAMLPAYLSYFLGIEGQSDDGDARRGILRALYIGSVVSLGFLAVFGAVGILVSVGVSSIRDVIPWVTIVIGGAMVVLGISMLFGYRLNVAIPKLDKMGDGQGFKSLFIFGVSYAIASISCAFPLFFIAVIGGSAGFGAGVAAFVAYTAGMSVVLLALTVSLSVARRSLVQTLRRAMMHVDRFAGAFLILAGFYTMWFWITDIRGNDQAGPIRWVENLSGNLQEWVQEQGIARIGLGLAMVVTISLIYLVARPATTSSPQREPADS